MLIIFHIVSVQLFSQVYRRHHLYVWQDLKDLKEVIVATGAEESILQESKGATRLSKQVERMISQMDTVMTSLNTEKDTLLENIEMQEVKIKRNQKLRDDTDLRQTVLDKISEEKWVETSWFNTHFMV